MMQLAALALRTQEVSGTHPSEPSGSTAMYLKEPKKKRKKRPGAKTQAILMSVFATLKQRSHNGTATIVEALRTSLTTKKITNLPIPADSAE